MARPARHDQPADPCALVAVGAASDPQRRFEPRDRTDDEDRQVSAWIRLRNLLRDFSKSHARLEFSWQVGSGRGLRGRNGRAHS